MLKVESDRNLNLQDNRTKQTNSSNNASKFTDDETGDTDFENSDFARVFESLSKKDDQTNAEKDKQTTSETDKKTHENESNSKSDKTSGKTTSENKQPAKQGEKPKDATGREDIAGAANARSMNTENFVETEQSLPPARAILHIADIERIVSTLRTQSFDGNQQVTITLKNSVMNGLQIKLTADENHKITAEFIAGNEKVKAQLDSRSNELADIMRRRGIQLASLKTSVGAESSTANSDDDSSKQQSQIVAASANSTKSNVSSVGTSEIETNSTEDLVAERDIYRA